MPSVPVALAVGRESRKGNSRFTQEKKGIKRNDTIPCTIHHVDHTTCSLELRLELLKRKNNQMPSVPVALAWDASSRQRKTPHGAQKTTEADGFAEQQIAAPTHT
jgi:hypothetical protein